MKTKKKFFSQMLSLVLIVSLVMGNMNIMTALAAEDRSTVYFGTSNDDVYGTKKAEWVGERAQITFDITAKKAINTVNQVVKTDIVLVLDRSGSMSDNSKMSKVKIAAKEFVTGLLAGEYSDSVQMGVVTYSEGASSLLPGTGLSNNAETINSKITAIGTPSGGTNIQAGLRKANEILAASKIDHASRNEEVKQYIVLLSDGEPTYSYQASGYDAVKQRLLFDTGMTRKGNGNDYTFKSYNVNYTVQVVKTENVIKFNGAYYNSSSVNLTSLNPSTTQIADLKLKVYWRDWSGTSNDGWFSDSNQYANIKFSTNKNDSLVKETYTSWGTKYGYITFNAYTATYTTTEERKVTVSNNGTPTMDEAAAIKDGGTTIYTIGYDIATGTNNASTVMQGVASSADKFKRASSSSSSTSIQEILNEISEEVQEIIDTASGAKVVDKIPAWFIVDESTLPSGVSYDSVTRTLTWNLGDLRVPEDQESIRRTVSIYMDLDKSELDANVVAAAGDYVETNAGCTLNYTNSKSTPMVVDTKSASGATANPALALPTYNYSINYIIEGNKSLGGTIDGSSTTVSGKAFLGDQIFVKTTLGNLNLSSDQYQNPSFIGTTTVNGSQHLTVGSDNATNTATVTVNLNRYIVTFYSKESGSQGNTPFETAQTIVYGTKAAKPAATPQKPADAQYTYQFSGWSVTDTTLSNVTSNLDVYPSFGNALQNYTIKFYRDLDAFNAGQTLAVHTVHYGTNNVVAPASPSVPTNPNSDYDYTFDRWNMEQSVWQNITGNVDVIGSFNQTLKNATVYFYDLERNQIGEPQIIPYRTSATAPTAFDKEVILENEVRIFNDTWDKLFDAVTTPELHVYAQYRTVARYYTVEYYGADGDTTPLYTDPKVDYKDASSYSGTPPTKVDPTNQYTYTFNNTWKLGDGSDATSALNSVTSNLKVYAGFDKSENKFTFTFYYWDENGNDTSTVIPNISWGASVVPPAVTTVSGSGIIKEFNNWAGDDYSSIKKNGSATATAAMTYAVTFIYGDNQSEIQYVPENGSATAPTNTDKSQDAIYTYTFAGWDKTFNNITEPTTVTAQYTPTQREYTINFINDVTKESLGSAPGKHHGDKVTVPTAEQSFVRDGYTYTFTGWEDNIADEVTVTGDKTYHAYYTSEINKYNVKFIDVMMTDDSDLVSEGNEISSASIDHNGDATLAASEARTMIDVSAKNTAKYLYTFAGWVTAPGGEVAANLTGVTGDMTVYASYTRELLNYTVIFKDDAAHGDKVLTATINGLPVGAQLLPYGGTAVEPLLGSEFFKDTDSVSTIYEDPYWNSDAWKNVGTNGQYNNDRVITITLTRPSAPARYEVEFYSEDRTQKFINETEAGIYVFTYGDLITSKPANQVKDSTPTHNFTFAGWGTQPNSSGELVDLSTRIVDGPGIKLYAQFEQSDRYYTVTFLDEHGGYFGVEAPYVASVLYEGTTVGATARNMAESKALQYADDQSTLSKRVTFLYWSTAPVGSESERLVADLTRITGNLKVYAMNADTTNEYTITYMSDEYGSESNNIFATDTAIGGTRVSFDASEEENTYLIRKQGPSKVSESHRYIFTNWRVFADFGEESFELNSNDELLSALQSDLVLYPVFERAIKTFTVTFVDWDGKVLKTQENIPYGEGATAPANPARADVYTSTTRTAFTFSGWDKDYSEISGDMTITAEYTSVVYNLNPSNPEEPTPSPTVTPTPIPEVIIPEVTPPAGPGTKEEEELEIPEDETPQGSTKPATKPSTKGEKQDAQLPSKNKNTEGDTLVINENKTPRGAASLPKTGESPMDILYGVGMVCSLIGASVSFTRRKKNKEK